MKYLIEHGATIDMGYGVTPLTTACEYGSEIVVEYLIEQGADINKETIGKGLPLFSAFQSENESLVKYLIKQHLIQLGVDITGENEESIVNYIYHFFVKKIKNDRYHGENSISIPLMKKYLNRMTKIIY